VRFGNVLGSRGSVVPTFERQIRHGGPVTVTHPEVKRYFISLTEAIALVIQAATLTQGNDLFMLDMGEQIRIDELARRLIRLRGLRPGIDVPIKYTGLRPGEKLEEELLGDGETWHSTSHPRVFNVQTSCSWNVKRLEAEVETLLRLAQNQSREALLEQLWRIVQGEQQAKAVHE
jgi:FlaA1/EpsC-like NDP-sugar epimerase